MVKTLDFDQPTAWLAVLLDRHPHLWQRAWAIDQLALRTDDSLAGAALARAARGADFSLTRAEAATALRRFPAAVALPALAAAARDTSARVRVAAVSSLAAVGGPQALVLAAGAWRSDSSYEVRAAGLLALARLGAPDARAAVLRALETPSYRDVIQNAAITAVVRRPDPELVAAVARQAGAQPLPTAGLAALVASGDSTARRAMLVTLNDERDWVRGWALEALEEQLDRPAAVALLREARPTLTREPARAAVIEALGRLERAPK